MSKVNKKGGILDLLSRKEQIEDEENKKFRDFTTFIAFSLIFRFVPMFEGFTENTILKVILSLIIAAIIQRLFVKSKLSFHLRNICERLKIKVSYLYIAYISIYFIILPMIFPLIYN